jgi:hypothetical protein
MSFLNRGLLISTSISILLCGAVMYLCHLRMSRLEEAVSRQNKVIASFLENVHRDVASSSEGGLAAPSACAAAERFIGQSADNRTNNVRITVSDDDVDEDESESDASSSDEESDADSDSDVDIDVPRLTVTEISSPDIQLTELPPMVDTIKRVHLDGSAVGELDAVDITPDDSSSSEEEDDTDDEDDGPEPSPEPSPSPHPKEKDGKIKVEDLRKQAIDANLCTKDQAKKLKKAALLALIQTSQGGSTTLTVTDLEE